MGPDYPFYCRNAYGVAEAEKQLIKRNVNDVSVGHPLESARTHAL